MTTNNNSSERVLRDSRGRFLKGCVANPAGRPQGASCRALRMARQAAEEVALPALIEAAKGGDMEACRVLVGYGLPRQKPVEVPEPVNLPDGSAGEQARAVLSEVAEGRLSIEAGARLLDALKARTQIEMTTDFENRLAALEAAYGGKKSGR